MPEVAIGLYFSLFGSTTGGETFEKQLATTQKTINGDIARLLHILTCAAPADEGLAIPFRLVPIHRPFEKFRKTTFEKLTSIGFDAL